MPSAHDARSSDLLDLGHDQSHPLVVEQVSKGVLKAKMLEYFRRIEETGEPIEVTDNGRPVLRVIPIRKVRPIAEVFADWRNRVVIRCSEEELLAPEWPDEDA